MASIRANGIRHFLRREGDRCLPALVLAHPIGFDHGLWDRVVPLLTDRLHVVRYDLRNHGGSEVTGDPHSVDLLAQDALAILDALGLDSVGFAGTSLGGLVGLRLAVMAPTRVRRLVVANASAKLPLPVEDWNRRIELALSEGTEAFVDGVVERMFSEPFRTTQPAILQTLVEAFRAMSGSAYAAALAALRDADLVETLPDVGIPSLVIAGETDIAVPRAHSQAMADAMPSAQLVVLPGGHLSAVESPSPFAEAVLDLLASPALN